MKSELIEIRENQRNSWNAFSPGWKKWDVFTMHFLEEQGNHIIEALDLQSSDHILDIASGTGEPGLTIAAHVLTNGLVTATDLSGEMLSIAKEKASQRAIGNFEVQVADACELPFEDATFDAVCCRLGFMFFPDMEMAAREMLRVLKPGGKIVTTVWAEPEKNFWITSIMGVLKKHLEILAANPAGPGLFRCAKPGFLTGLFNEIGIEGGQEKEISGVMKCHSAQEYWEFMNDVVPPVVSSLKAAEVEVKQKVKNDVFKIFKEKITGPDCHFPYGARLFSVRKPR
jgi:ubiquinone/menaquinone biosynthesis C-methylase UbiE